MRWLTALAALVLVVLAGRAVLLRTSVSDSANRAAGATRAAPVQVSDVVTGPIQQRRVYSGALEARAEFVVAPKIAGRIESIAVDLADPVQRGQVVAELDDAEYRLAVAQAQAELEVAEATATEAAHGLEIAGRELRRLEKLREQDIASDSQIDVVRAEALSKEGSLAVARAQVTRAAAALEAAKIRLGYTRVRASWSGPGQVRVVAERYVDEGGTVSANTPLMSIVSLDPITGVIFVTEKDYGSLADGQQVQLRTDAYGDRDFAGRVKRISPVFRQNSRQARVEMTIDNPENLLKPGMFIRAEIVLDQIPDATIVPLDALVTRDGQQGVFLLSDDGSSVHWRVVRAGVREGLRVQVFGEQIAGRVVTLGQQLIDDGSGVVIPDDPTPAAPASPESRP